MAEKKKRKNYVEPDGYFPKSVQKYFKAEKKTATKKATKKK